MSKTTVGLKNALEHTQTAARAALAEQHNANSRKTAIELLCEKSDSVVALDSIFAHLSPKLSYFEVVETPLAKEVSLTDLKTVLTVSLGQHNNLIAQFGILQKISCFEVMCEVYEQDGEAHIRYMRVPECLNSFLPSTVGVIARLQLPMINTFFRDVPTFSYSGGDYFYHYLPITSLPVAVLNFCDTIFDMGTGTIYKSRNDFAGETFKQHLFKLPVNVVKTLNLKTNKRP